MKYLLILTGFVFIGLAVLGIFLPGLPATPFLLLASAAFIKSSPRLHIWLNKHRIFGKLLSDFEEKKGIRIEIKVISVLLMLVMSAISVIFFIENNWVKVIVGICALIGSVVVFSFKTVK